MYQLINQYIETESKREETYAISLPSNTHTRTHARTHTHRASMFYGVFHRHIYYPLTLKLPRTENVLHI